MLSRLGSTYSSTSSINNGLPKLTASSTLFLKYLLLKLVIIKFLPSFLLIHCLACDCGSIINGYLLPSVVIIPFCTLNSSLGNPFNCHSSKVFCSNMNVCKLKSLEGILYSFNFIFQLHIILCL
eukprot:NODE_73_length_23464_cov_0.600171.p10 type:complete len:124 gc:universal NODE_73_length_23464_cov_0.600171:12905-13276(+)